MVTKINGGVCTPQGYKASGVHCGIRKNRSKQDLALIKSDVMANVAAVFTQNKVKGAPLIVSKENMADGKAQAIICNSGNANTCAPNGIDVAKTICELTAKSLDLKMADVMVNSTGVIGQELLLEPFERGIPEAATALSYSGGTAAAQAIMTTDTTEKEVAFEFSCGGKTCKIGAIGKGSGMIHPNMATMLIFITTDVAISSDLLQKALSADIKDTFNQISVDGDTSTNDTVILMANGMSGNAEINEENDDYVSFCTALNAITTFMSRKIAGDGEGATKLLECVVSGANSKENARKISKSIICSSLFKAAMFGADANWGRALCAIGYTEGEFSIDKVSVSLKSKAGQVDVCENAAHKIYSEDEASKILAEEEIQILVDMHDGDQTAKAWGCDLTYDYVKINGDYRTQSSCLDMHAGLVFIYLVAVTPSSE